MRLRAFLVAVVLAGCAGGDTVGTAEQKLISGSFRTFNPEVPVPGAYNTLTDAAGTSCVRLVKGEDCGENPPRTKTSGFSDSFDLDIVTSRSELKNKLNVNANLSVRYKVVEASASVNIEKEAEFTSNSITFLLKGETSYWNTVDENVYTPTLTDAARGFLDEENKPQIPAQFFRSCGDSWINGAQRGAQFLVLIKFTASSAASRDALEAKLKAEVKLPVVGANVEAGVSMLNAAKQFGARATIKVRADGFSWDGTDAAREILRVAQGNELTEDTFAKFLEVRTAMQQAIHNDLCTDSGFKRAKKDGQNWVCEAEGVRAPTLSHVLRVAVKDYNSVANLPAFNADWEPLVTYQQKLVQAAKYIALLGQLEDRVQATYYDELTPYGGGNVAARARYGLAPPQIRPRNEPAVRLTDQDTKVNFWAGRFRPPAGVSFNRVHAAGKNCWQGVTNANFDGCTCPGRVVDLTDRCLATLDAYRMTWNDLFEYSETGRVLPIEVFGPSDTQTYDAATTTCRNGIELADKTKLQGSMIGIDQARRAALYLASPTFKDARHAAWYANPALGTDLACPRSGYSAADARTYTRPWFQNIQRNDGIAPDGTGCATRDDKAGVLCVAQGGMFSFTTYPDRLQGLPRPPPYVTAAEPGARALGVAPDARITLVFTSSLDADTVTAANVKVEEGGAAIDAELVYTPNPLGGGTVVITPSAPLKESKTYTIVVGTGVKGAEGDAMLAAYRSTFTVANQVSAVTPEAGATGVALDSKLEVTFAAPVNATTATATQIKLWNGNVAVPAAVSYAAATRKATLTPTRELSASTTYTFAIDGVRDPGALGNPVTRTVGTFKTGIVPTTLFPEDGSTEVDRGHPIAAVYSDVLGEEQVDGNFTLKKNGTTAIEGSVVVNPQPARGLRFRPAQPLEANTRFTATVTKLVRDADGKPAVKAKSWSFTTGNIYTPDL